MSESLPHPGMSKAVIEKKALDLTTKLIRMGVPTDPELLAKIASPNTKFEDAEEAFRKLGEMMRIASMKAGVMNIVARRTKGRVPPVKPIKTDRTSKSLPKRNEPCWCGSEKKFKKCHMFGVPQERKPTTGTNGMHDKKEEIDND